MATGKAIASLFRSLEMAGARGGPKRETTEELRHALEFWVRIFADETDEQVTAMAVKWVRSGEGSQWWPTPGQLLALDPQRQLEAMDDSADAWGELMQMIARIGPYTTPIGLSSAMSSGLRALGGWSAVCGMSHTDLGYRRRSFIDAYNVGKTRDDVVGPALTDGEARSFLTDVGEAMMANHGPEDTDR